MIDRREQGSIFRVFRLRTGHNCLSCHLYSKLHIGHTEQCPCGTGSQTTEHLLQSCPIYVLYACVLYFCICTCSAQLSMFHMERHSRNTLIIIIIIIIIIIYKLFNKGIWPDYTSITCKLYGSLEDLRHTATFIQETGVSI